jgi:hypothetical protein
MGPAGAGRGASRGRGLKLPAAGVAAARPPSWLARWVSSRVGVGTNVGQPTRALAKGPGRLRRRRRPRGFGGGRHRAARGAPPRPAHTHSPDQRPPPRPRRSSGVLHHVAVTTTPTAAPTGRPWGAAAGRSPAPAAGEPTAAAAASPCGRRRMGACGRARCAQLLADACRGACSGPPWQRLDTPGRTPPSLPPPAPTPHAATHRCSHLRPSASLLIQNGASSVHSVKSMLVACTRRDWSNRRR